MFHFYQWKTILYQPLPLNLGWVNQSVFPPETENQLGQDLFF